MLLLAFLLLLTYLLFPGVPTVADTDFPSVVKYPANGFPPFLASLLLSASFDVPNVSCAAFGHAVAVFINAVLSLMRSLLARVSAVAAVPVDVFSQSSATCVSKVWCCCLPLLASLMLLGPCHLLMRTLLLLQRHSCSCLSSFLKL
jgi:hypothetical protein